MRHPANRSCLLVATAVAVIGCAGFRGRSGGSPPRIDVEVASAEAPEWGLGRVTLSVVFRVSNPLDEPVSLEEAEVTSRAGRRAIRSDRLPPPGRLAAGASRDVPVRIELSAREIAAGLGAPPDGDVVLEVQLAVRRRSHEAADPWPSATWSAEVPVLIAPTVELVGLDPRSLSPLAADVGVELEIGNPNRRELELRHVDLTITLDGQTLDRVDRPVIEHTISGGSARRLEVGGRYRLTGGRAGLYDVFAAHGAVAAVTGVLQFGVGARSETLELEVAVRKDVRF